MKCDKLKPLKNLEVAFNTTKEQEQVIAEDSEGNCYGFDSWEEVYLKDEVDAAIAELKEKLHDAEMQADLAECAVTEYKIDYDKLNDENRRLKRALWLARAERAKESHFMWCQLIYDKKYGIVKFNVRKEWGENTKQWQMLHTPQGWADVWDDVERKCRAKAEEYK